MSRFFLKQLVYIVSKGADVASRALAQELLSLYII